jgi:hypothetical protein
VGQERLVTIASGYFESVWVPLLKVGPDQRRVATVILWDDTIDEARYSVFFRTLLLRLFASLRLVSADAWCTRPLTRSKIDLSSAESARVYRLFDGNGEPLFEGLLGESLTLGRTVFQVENYQPIGGRQPFSDSMTLAMYSTDDIEALVVEASAAAAVKSDFSAPSIVRGAQRTEAPSRMRRILEPVDLFLAYGVFRHPS